MQYTKAASQRTPQKGHDMANRRKYLFTDRAEAEAAYKEANDRAGRLSYCMGKGHCYESRAKVGESSYRVRIWTRPIQGRAYWAVYVPGGMVVADGDDIAKEAERVRHQFHTDSSMCYRQAIDDAAQAAHKLMFGQNVAS